MTVVLSPHLDDAVFSCGALIASRPGAKVVVPSTPYDAKGLLKEAIRHENPVVFFEDKMMYKLKGPVPAEDYTIPLGVADVKREGEDITFVATSSMVQVALGAAKLLEEIGLSAEVIDPRTTYPLDKQALIESAKKTSRAIVVDEGYERYGVTAEIASVIAEGAFYYLDAPVKRLGIPNVPIPFSRPLEQFAIPSVEAIANAARQLTIHREVDRVGIRRPQPVVQAPGDGKGGRSRGRISHGVGWIVPKRRRNENLRRARAGARGRTPGRRPLTSDREARGSPHARRQRRQRTRLL